MKNKINTSGTPILNFCSVIGISELEYQKKIIARKIQHDLLLSAYGYSSEAAYLPNLGKQ
ncbi:hypothetical protein HK16_18455 [Acetobacter senegalensis]|uniref:Uncharacterized protein n=2 Tax=Acetobacter TaxID=434 RepID=A0A149TU35_9PROT|nr:hypothetical protein CIW82_05585 [Acetobacter tropicalis]KXV56642.1 hypothetical protein AD948_17390 [Acetobacter senegalensis]OUL65196.1 hypothetical protein HK16_18455 [Acetobacter senegalensis]